MSTDSDGYVWLSGGLIVPVAPLRLLLALESRGFDLSRDGDDILAHPSSKLTDEDRRELKLWRRHVLALIDYEAEHAGNGTE